MNLKIGEPLEIGAEIEELEVVLSLYDWLLLIITIKGEGIK